MRVVLLHLISAVISDAEVQLHFDEFFEEIFVEMEDKVTVSDRSVLVSQRATVAGHSFLVEGFRFDTYLF